MAVRRKNIERRNEIGYGGGDGSNAKPNSQGLYDISSFAEAEDRRNWRGDYAPFHQYNQPDNRPVGHGKPNDGLYVSGYAAPAPVRVEKGERVPGLNGVGQESLDGLAEANLRGGIDQLLKRMAMASFIQKNLMNKNFTTRR